MQPLRVASVQMISTPNLEANLDTAARWVGRAMAEGADLVLLPEYFCFMGHKDTDKLELAEAPGQGPIQSFLADLARSHGITLIGGTIPLRVEGQTDGEAARVYNSCLVYNPQGQQQARYDKIHLFCFQKGAESYDEARVLKAGTQPVVTEVAGYRIGLSVCYDLRFPELYRGMAEQGGPVDLITMPAAFTATTGRAHWEVLLRARAIENQCYVLASGQGGVHDNGRRTHGHSMVVSPWGVVEQVLEEGEGIVLGTLDPDKMNDVRASLPALKHRVF